MSNDTSTETQTPEPTPETPAEKRERRSFPIRIFVRGEGGWSLVADLPGFDELPAASEPAPTALTPEHVETLRALRDRSGRKCLHHVAFELYEAGLTHGGGSLKPWGITPAGVAALERYDEAARLADLRAQGEAVAAKLGLTADPASEPALRALIIYHADCTDGACAAWAARHHCWRAGFETMLLPTHPGVTPEGAFAEAWAHVFIVDVCIPRADIERLGAWVLDHHKTNGPLLEGYGRAVFDLNRSGAGLAWDEVQAILWSLGCGVRPEQPRPWFVSYVEDRDLWRWALPYSREVNAVLSLGKRAVDDFDQWEPVATKAPPWSVVSEGRTILAVESEAVERACRHPLFMSLASVSVVLVTSPLYQSEIGNQLASAHGMPAVIWYLRQDEARGPVAQVSLRSRDDLADVSELAARLGGGGHRNAAGAVVDASKWLALVGGQTTPTAPPTRTCDWLNTATGRKFPFLAPTAGDIDIVDIAIGLGHQARYAGQTRQHYSVALHSVLVARVIRALGGSLDEQRWGLLHDAAEAYVTDIPWPLKSAGLVPGLVAAERGIMTAVVALFGLSEREPALVKEIDLEMLEVESESLLVRHPDWEIARPARPEVREVWASREPGAPTSSGLIFMEQAIQLGLAGHSDWERMGAVVWGGA